MKSSYWYCDGCNRNINHGEFRFNCIVCDNYDYCEQCTQTITPPHPHRMVPELAYGREEEIECAKVDMATAIRAAIAMYWDRHCMGTRDIDEANSAIYKDSYSWMTFQTVGTRSKHFGHGLRRLIDPRGYLGICAGNRPDWMITDFACIFQSIISVPIYTLFTDHEIAFVINNTQVSAIVCDKQMLGRFVKIHSECTSLRHIICMDSIPETISSTQNHGLFIHYMGDIEKNGAMQKYEYVTTEPTDPVTIIYTSGSSGFPKGAVISESAFRATFPRWCLPSSLERVTLSYRPLAWAADRDAIITTFLCGGRTGFSTGDPSRLMEELVLVRPTYFGAPPSIWNKIYTEFKTSLALITATSPSETISDQEQRLLQHFSKLMPNRCNSITIGGAMVSPAVLNFMKRCFTHCSVNESYGITECGSVTYNNLLDGTLQYRLESVPHMGYTIDDKPYSRGELLTKTPQMFSGYINNPDETHAAITDDGFFRTGDIVEVRTDQSSQVDIRVIDRKKNFFKLSQGQFVSPEFLQSIYLQSPFVEQIYIHGDLLADSVSAVIVPNQQYAQAYVLQHQLPPLDMDNPHSLFRDAVLQDLRLLAQRESLRQHEIPSHIVIDFHPFTCDNGLLTSSMKPCRPKLAAHYAQQLKTPNRIQQQLKTIIETITGHPITDDTQENIFVSTGSDSLSAVRLSRMIEHDLGIPLPLHLLFHPTMNLQQLATLVQNPSQLSSFSYSILPQMIKDSNVDLNITVIGHKSPLRVPSMVFITGATGFVGAFLLTELLAVYPVTCRFVCLVRCDTSTNPLDRIRNNMLFYQIWKDEYQQRIIAVRGDLGKDHFDLDSDTYDSFAQQIDVIYHCGATVNFILPYNQLYDSNVVGTREIIRLAAHIPSSCIPIQYISTISVLSNDADKEISIDETSSTGLVSGYAQSKWVAEKLMSRANTCGIQVVIYRLGLICADSRTGACNKHDLYTLLFGAMMKISCYPKSITGMRLNGLPVDFTARSIVYLSNGEQNVYGNIYHVLNQKNEIRFEDIMDGIEKCGIEMKGVSDEEWKKTMNNENNRSLEFMGEMWLKSVHKERSVVSSETFSDHVSALQCPPVDKTYVIKWLRFIFENVMH